MRSFGILSLLLFSNFVFAIGESVEFKTPLANGAICIVRVNPNSGIVGIQIQNGTVINLPGNLSGVDNMWFEVKSGDCVGLNDLNKEQLSVVKKSLLAVYPSRNQNEQDIIRDTIVPAVNAKLESPRQNRNQTASLAVPER